MLSTGIEAAFLGMHESSMRDSRGRASIWGRSRARYRQQLEELEVACAR